MHSHSSNTANGYHPYSKHRVLQCGRCNLCEYSSNLGGFCFRHSASTNRSSVTDRCLRFPHLILIQLNQPCRWQHWGGLDGEWVKEATERGFCFDWSCVIVRFCYNLIGKFINIVWLPCWNARTHQLVEWRLWANGGDLSRKQFVVDWRPALCYFQCVHVIYRTLPYMMLFRFVICVLFSYQLIDPNSRWFMVKC